MVNRKTKDRNPWSKVQATEARRPSLPEEGHATRAVAARTSEARPVVEVEEAVAREQGERVLGAPPLIGGEVDHRGLVVPADDVRPHDGAEDSVEAVEDEPLWHRFHLLALRVNRVPLRRGRELDQGNWTLLRPLDKNIELASLDDGRLSRQLALAVVVEGTSWELLLVGATESEQQHIVERGAVFDDYHLRNDVRQMHALQSVLNLGVTRDLHLESADGVLEPGSLGQFHLALEGIAHPLETSDVVDGLRLKQVVRAIRIAHCCLDAPGRDASAVTVEEGCNNLFNRHLGTSQDSVDCSESIAIEGFTELVHERLILSSCQRTVLCHDGLLSGCLPDVL